MPRPGLRRARWDCCSRTYSRNMAAAAGLLSRRPSSTRNSSEGASTLASDTYELFFDGVRVPVGNLLGPSEGRGLFQMMDQFRYERLSIGLSAVVAAERAVEITAGYVKERKAFGKPLLDLQNTRLKLAECK